MNTTKNAIAKDNKPARVFSLPIVGPTFVCSLITHGAGNAQPFKRPARSLASSKVKSPDICVFPLLIALLTTGAL